MCALLDAWYKELAIPFICLSSHLDCHFHWIRSKWGFSRNIRPLYQIIWLLVLQVKAAGWISCFSWTVCALLGQQEMMGERLKLTSWPAVLSVLSEKTNKQTNFKKKLTAAYQKPLVMRLCRILAETPNSICAVASSPPFVQHTAGWRLCGWGSKPAAPAENGYRAVQTAPPVC